MCNSSICMTRRGFKPTGANKEAPSVCMSARAQQSVWCVRGSSRICLSQETCASYAELAQQEWNEVSLCECMRAVLATAQGMEGVHSPPR